MLELDVEIFVLRSFRSSSLKLIICGLNSQNPNINISTLHKDTVALNKIRKDMIVSIFIVENIEEEEKWNGGNGEIRK